MGKFSKSFGNLGEEMAAEHLRSLGYKIVERNFRSSQGEIDIITEDKDVLVFVEVKNYSFRSYGSPLWAVGKNKQRNIIHAASTYLFNKKIVDKNCRFDVVAIYWESVEEKKIELIKDAFRIT